MRGEAIKMEMLMDQNNNFLFHYQNYLVQAVGIAT